MYPYRNPYGTGPCSGMLIEALEILGMRIYVYIAASILLLVPIGAVGIDWGVLSIEPI